MREGGRHDEVLSRREVLTLTYSAMQYGERRSQSGCGQDSTMDPTTDHNFLCTSGNNTLETYGEISQDDLKHWHSIIAQVPRQKRRIILSTLEVVIHR